MSSCAWSQARRTVWFGRLEPDAAELRHGPGPAAVRRPRCTASVLGRRFELGQRQPAQAGVPDALGRDLGDEHEPAVGELRLAVGAVGRG